MIKDYLSKPPVMVPPEPGRPLFLYLSVMDNSFGCVLGYHDATGKKEQWVEAITFKSVTKKAVVDFVHSNIICRLSIPKTIITDNATNLNSHLMKEVREQFQIIHRHSTPYRPKANRAVEAANKNIKKILRKMIQGPRQWHKKLPFAFLGYRTTARTSVGATPYLLVYGTEAVIPAQAEIPSLRIIVESDIEDRK
ncbi:PREDICTED: uncharacterized protein K02A2.6-like [Nicotiana attenuata]|uniref:uncharacterized protein K02A2.6-like n=1 Tax=Nicotiana attenuata TaxID=49451 RepID=UPI000904A4A2|nr:PREDICTED: uncharacterized protein K02A2.6-like [Nicotiana attenuata]